MEEKSRNGKWKAGMEEGRQGWKGADNRYRRGKTGVGVGRYGGKAAGRPVQHTHDWLHQIVSRPTPPPVVRPSGGKKIRNKKNTFTKNGGVSPLPPPPLPTSSTPLTPPIPFYYPSPHPWLTWLIAWLKRGFETVLLHDYLFSGPCEAFDPRRLFGKRKWR